MLGIGYLHLKDGAPDAKLIHAGGGFGLLAAFFAWYNALAGLADTSNRYVAPDPWFTLSHGSRQAAPCPTHRLFGARTTLEMVGMRADCASVTASSSFLSHTSRGLRREGWRATRIRGHRRGRRDSWGAWTGWAYTLCCSCLQCQFWTLTISLCLNPVALKIVPIGTARVN